MSERPPTSRPPVTTAPAAVASMGARFLACLVDVAILLLAAAPVVLGVATDTGWLLVAVGWLLVVAVSLMQWVWHGTRGWTLGRLSLGLRTVDVETLRPVGLGRVLLRALVVAAGALALGVGQLVVLASPLFDSTGRNRGWHDRAAGDEVIDLRAREPEPAPRWFDGGTGDVRAPAPEAAPRTPVAGAPVVPAWVTAADPADAPTVTGSTPLVLAPLMPREHGPDVDTRTIPIVRVGAKHRFDAATAVVEVPVMIDVPSPGRGAPDRDTGSGHDGHALDLDPELEMTRRAVPRPQPEALEEPRTSAEIALSDGRRVVVEGVALVGRNPSAAVDVQTVRVIDPGRSVSKTHLQVAVTPAGIWVADRGSTNGTVVTLPDGAQVVCPVDHPIRLRPGSTVSFGDYSFVVVRGPVPPV